MAKSNAAHAKSPDAKPASSSDAKDDLKTLPIAEVEKRLGSSPNGLTGAEAAKRLAQYGPNEIEEKKTNAFLKFLMYFWGPIPWMIEVAVVLSGVVRHWPDFFIILLLLCANACVGFWEERQAGNAIEALKAKLAIKARVKRDGKWINPPAKEVVPGDIIRLRLGDIVPADARLLEGDEVSVDQAALTGESLPASKKPGDAVFSGSIIRRGEIGALVYATGGKNYFGKTADLVQTAHTVSHFQKAVLRIGNYLIILAVALVVVIIGVAVYRGDPILTTLQFALVLTVAAIPVAMPTVLSVTMAVGARLLAKKQAIVSKLVAIEELAGVDVLCADKTGTLTQNKLTLGDPFCIGDAKPAEVILAGALASRAEDNDVIDLAVLGGLKDDKALQSYDVQHFQPFDPVHKRTEATVTGGDGAAFKVTKGAPQVILALAANAAAVKDAMDKAVNDFAARGFRALGVARADGDGKWQLLGVLPLFDPPREDAKSTVATARQMGVQLKMVTGDALAIARETAKTLGMGANILDGASLGDSKQDATADVAKSIEQADGFAQVFPEHKFHIVDVLQKHGHIVGMTGDGVNDAPGAEAGGLRHRRVGCHRRGASGGGHCADDAGALGDHRRDQGEPEDFPADEQLRNLPHRGDAARAAVHDAVDPGVQLLPAHRRDDRHAGVAQRRGDPVDRLRQRPLQGRARSLEHARRAGCLHGARRARRHRRVRAVLPRRACVPHRPRTHPDHDVFEAVGRRAPDDLPDAHPRPVLVHPSGSDPVGRGAGNAGFGDVHRAVRVRPGDAAGMALGPAGLGLGAGLVPRERPGQAVGLFGPRSPQDQRGDYGGSAAASGFRTSRFRSPGWQGRCES